MQLRVPKLGSLLLSSLSFNTAVELAQDASEQFFLVTTQTRGHSEISSGRRGVAGAPVFVVVGTATRDVVAQPAPTASAWLCASTFAAMTALCASLLGGEPAAAARIRARADARRDGPPRALDVHRATAARPCLRAAAGAAPLVYRRPKRRQCFRCSPSTSTTTASACSRQHHHLHPRHVRAADSSCTLPMRRGRCYNRHRRRRRRRVRTLGTGLVLARRHACAAAARDSPRSRATTYNAATATWAGGAALGLRPPRPLCRTTGSASANCRRRHCEGRLNRSCIRGTVSHQ
ncbi:MAG: hypothetical protein IPG91_24085 [Ideonella sp.]|nr:hypothetical protein [Ideonella sp.]